MNDQFDWKDPTNPEDETSSDSMQPEGVNTADTVGREEKSASQDDTDVSFVSSGTPGRNPPASYPPLRQPGYPPVYGGTASAEQPDSSWTFRDYGPLGGQQTPQKPKKQKPPKAPKPPKVKKEKQPGAGYKTLAVLMCILFVLSVAGFGSYIVYDIHRYPAAVLPPSADSSVPSGSDNILSLPKNDASDGTLTGNQIHQKVEPTVVGIAGYLQTGIGSQLASQGSGVIITEDGCIVTNNHVISNEQTNSAYEKVEVILASGDSYEAKVLGRDKESDLAVLKIEATGLPTVEFGDSDQVKVGDRTYVIGNPSGLAFAGSFTGGYISAVNRYVDVEGIGSKVEFIQTDAAINPGNSGGALVNEYGQLIGITSAKLVNSAYEGMGFAIPSNNVRPIVESLMEYGWVRGRVQLGISYTAVKEVLANREGIPRGLRVVIINEDSDVANTRIQLGDIIYRMDGQEVYDAATIAQVLEGKKPGDTVRLSVYHVTLDDKAEYFEVDVTLQEKPNTD